MPTYSLYDFEMGEDSDSGSEPRKSPRLISPRTETERKPINQTTEWRMASLKVKTQQAQKTESADYVTLKGNFNARISVEKWLSNTVFGKLPVASEMRILCGPPGTGKTRTAVEVLARGGYTIVRCNASDDRSAQKLEHLLRSSGRSKGLGRPVAVLLDEVDGLHLDGGAHRVLQKVKCTNPVIGTANAMPRELRNVLGPEVILWFCALWDQDIRGIAVEAARAAGRTLSASDIHAITEAAGGDARQAVILASSAQRMSVEACMKDPRHGAFDLAKHIVRGDRTAIRWALEGEACSDPGLLGLICSDSLLPLTNYNAKFASLLSDADSIGRCHGTKHVAGALLALGAAHHVTARKGRVSVQPPKYLRINQEREKHASKLVLIRKAIWDNPRDKGRWSSLYPGARQANLEIDSLSAIVEGRAKQEGI